MARFVLVGCGQRRLLLIDLREWKSGDNIVHFAIEAVDRVPLSRFSQLTEPRTTRRRKGIYDLEGTKGFLLIHELHPAMRMPTPP